MPSGDFTRPTGPKKKLKKKPALAPPRPDIQTSGTTGTGYTKPKAKKTVTRAPISDVRSSGRDYSKKTVDTFKKTAKYKATVKAAKKHGVSEQELRDRVFRKLGVPRGGRITLDAVQTAGFGAALDSVAGDFANLTGKGLDVVGQAVRPALAIASLGASELPVGKTFRKLATNAGKDVLNLPVQAVPSVYHLGERVGQGKFEEAGEMLLQPYKDLVKDPGKAFTEHPVNNALLVAGPVRGTTRGTGAIMRKVPATKKAASTARKPKTLPGTNLKQQQTYSPDPVVKAAQVVAEKRKLRKVRQLREEADRVENTSVARAAELREKAARKDPTRVKAKEVKRRVDERVAATEDVRRANRTATVNEARKILRPARGGGASLSLIAQNIVKADKADLRRYMGELETEFAGLGKAGQRANKSLRQEIQKVLDDKDWDAGAVEVAARRYAEFNRVLQDDLVKLKLLAPDQAEAARLVPYAVRRMGATHDGKRLVAKDPPRRVLKKTGEKTIPFDKSTVKERLREHPELEKPWNEYIALLNTDTNVATALRKAKALEPRLAPILGDDGGLHVRTYRTVLDGGGGERPLTPALIREHMRENNASEPAFISQAPNARGGRNFYVASNEAPAIGKARRTGEATRKGTFDSDPETLVEAAARSQGLRDAADGFRKFVGEFAHTNERGKVRTYSSHKKAAQAAADLAADGGGVRFRPVRINPWAASKEQLAQLLDDVDAESAQTNHAITEAIQDALKAEGGPGPWALIPEAAAKQMRDHMGVLDPTTAGKVGQIVNNAFRQTVLSMSPKWITGNTVEAGLRMGVAGAGLGSWRTGRKVLKRAEELDPGKATEARARTVGGGHFSMAERQHIHRDASQFKDTALEGTARGLGAFWRTPGPKQLAQMWHGYSQFVFRTLNGNMEAQFQTAMLGKALRKSPLMDKATLKQGETAVDQAARGLLNTDEQVAFGRAVDRMYGRYGKFSPNMRRMVALYTPFVAWSLNAVRFVYGTLPKDHPVQVSLIAAAELASEEWRKERGLDLFMEEGVPSFLQGSIPGKDGSHLRLSRYTPFGAFADPGATFGDSVLPQFSGVLAALKDGEDWKGDKLMKDGRPVDDFFGRAAFAAQYFAEATIPALSQAKGLITDEGPVGDRLRKRYDPFKFTPGPKKKITKTAVPAGVSEREIELLKREQQSSSSPSVSQREIEMLLREQGGG